MAQNPMETRADDEEWLRWLTACRNAMTAQPEATLTALRRERVAREKCFGSKFLDHTEVDVTRLQALPSDAAVWTDEEKLLVIGTANAVRIFGMPQRSAASDGSSHFTLGGIPPSKRLGAKRTPTTRRRNSICKVYKNHHAGTVRCLPLERTIDGVIAMAEPLGLSGAFTVLGIDTNDYGADGYPRIVAPEQWNANGQVVVFAKCAEHRFQLMLSPEITPFHVMRRAADEYVRLHGESRWHHYFESMAIDVEARVIDLGMGS